METLRPPTPISVPQTTAPGTSGGEVTVSTSNANDIDSKPDARAPGASGVAAAPAAGGQTQGPAGSTAVGGNAPATADASAPPQAPLPTNYQTQKTKQKSFTPERNRALCG